MKFERIAAIGALALCVACGPLGGPQAAPKSAQGDAAPAQSSCPDDGPRLPGTGLCQRTAMILLEHAEGARAPTLPEGCTMSVNETMMIGDEALIYAAAKCGETTTKLAFSAGAHAASITYETSATGVGRKDTEVVRLFGVDPDPQGALKEQLEALPAAERATCAIQPAGVEGWPADAVIIAPTPAARARMSHDGPIAACGPMGLDEDTQRYWRIRQGQAWFFELGQEDLDFDPATMTIIEKGADGSWIARK